MKRQESTPVGLMSRISQPRQEAGKLHQAVVTYFELVEYFPETDEARRAHEQLLGLAQRTDEAWKTREQLLSLV